MNATSSTLPTAPSPAPAATLTALPSTLAALPSKLTALLLSLSCGLLLSTAAQGQDVAEDEAQPRVEEIVVVGTQIQGVSISDLLPVTVLTAEDVDALGALGGDELLAFLTEQGQNYFNESSSFNLSAGVNSARGDIGSFNLRDIGTGNTLVLLNGRRMVNASTFQEELVGGSRVPVNTVNSTSLPISGLRSLEVLKDGASAIYGADAVAGVVNYAMRSDFEGFRIRYRQDEYDNLPRENRRVTVEWGDSFNDDRTHVSGALYWYGRDRVSARDDSRWANADLRERAPAPYDGSDEDRDHLFDNTSSRSSYGQYDILNFSRSSSSSSARRLRGQLVDAGMTDSDGDFETYPTGHPDCVFQINEDVCGGADAVGAGNYRYNLNEWRDVLSELERTNLYMNLQHDFDSGMQGFGEFLWYNSRSERNISPAADLTSVSSSAGARIDDDNYYNPFGDVRYSEGRLDDVFDDNGVSVTNGGLTLGFDSYRWSQVPREVHVTADTYRVLGGLRGSYGEWDWEGALLWSQSQRYDLTHNRISQTLLQEGLNDRTEDAINPFAQNLEDSNLERALVSVYRENQQTLKMADFKLINRNLLDLAGGSVSVLLGAEHRVESFWEDRDPRLNGTVQYTDNADNTFPFVSDVVGSSPTPDQRGSREVTSVFGEMLFPLLEDLDVQAALRHEDFSDMGSTVVGKLALGWRPVDQLLLRASMSEAFRAPNLITMNENLVGRSVGFRQ